MVFEAAPAPLGTGAMVVYEATFTFSGGLARIEPLLKPLLNKVADDGARGMRAALDRL